jgi:hypothetical protein
MMLSDPDLWCRLRGVAIDPEEAALPFAGRLARDNGWTKGFACRVIEEYRRFLYLCCVAGHPVTPSDEVDQAWHQHLTYTRSYWDELCGDVLRRPLHHVPTRGGPDERARYAAQYRDTLDLYRREFGEAPPAEIWPDAATRFGRRYVRIDRDAVWTIDKDRYRRAIGLGFGGMSLALGLTACAQIAADVGTMSVAEKVVIVAFLAVVVGGLIRWTRMTPEERARQSRDGGGCGDSGCGGGCD